MKSKFTLLALFALAAAIVVGVPAFADILGTAHDFSDESWSNNEICSPCHTPHAASSDAALWARHALSSQGPYTLWPDSELGAESLTCLSCHDGTVAVGVNGTGPLIGAIDDDLDIGTDLTNDHPVGVAYSTSTSGTRWVVPTPNSRTTSLQNLGDMLIYLDEAGTDYRVECASCHAVHGAGFDDFLRADNEGSAVCLSCHVR